MTQQVARRSPAQELVAQVRQPSFQEQVQLALPEHIPASRFVRAAATALLTDEAIASAQPNSVFQALLRAAQDGLMPDGREAALVLFKQKGSQQKRAQYLPMIGGYRKIAAEHGWQLRTDVVYANDFFEYELGLEPRLVHKPVRPGEQRGEIVAAYAVAVPYAGGSHAPLFEVMGKGELERIRKTSRAKDDGPWVQWTDRMYEKTVGKRLFAKLPLGSRDHERVRRLIDYDALGPAEAEDLVYGPEPTPQPAAALPAAPQEEATGTPQAASSAFSGAEPPPPEPQASPAEYVLGEEFTRYAGKSLAEVAEAGDRTYLEWLASDAIDDEELRAAAAALLEEGTEK